MSYNEIYNIIGFDREMKRLKKQADQGIDREIEMLRYLGVKDDSTILEVGSGPGFYTENLLENFNKAHLFCLDNDEKLINYAINKLNKVYNERVNFINDDIMNSNMPDSYFDIIIARFVFQHLSSPVKALKEIYRILKPGGKVIIIDIENSLWGATYPKNKLIEKLNLDIMEQQKKLQGNREIGSVLLTLLKLTNFNNLKMEAVINHSELLGKDKFKNNLPKGLTNNASMERIIQEYNDFFDLKYSSIMLLKFFFYGEKN